MFFTFSRILEKGVSAKIRPMRVVAMAFGADNFGGEVVATLRKIISTPHFHPFCA